MWCVFRLKSGLTFKSDGGDTGWGKCAAGGMSWRASQLSRARNNCRFIEKGRRSVRFHGLTPSSAVSQHSTVQRGFFQTLVTLIESGFSFLQLEKLLGVWHGDVFTWKPRSTTGLFLRTFIRLQFTWTCWLEKRFAAVKMSVDAEDDKHTSQIPNCTFCLFVYFCVDTQTWNRVLNQTLRPLNSSVTFIATAPTR